MKIIFYCIQSQWLDKITRNVSVDRQRGKPCTKNWGTSTLSGYEKQDQEKKFYLLRFLLD